ncbi:hypothetical protein T492DRAFT_259995 [Pavlovales sp. CCMP2436]|nr:hypothetical protein T492DRAFT_259995 [Pavlovales sp. CCMP2436]
MQSESVSAEWVLGAAARDLPARSGHTATALGGPDHTDTVVVFGGAARGLCSEDLLVVRARTGAHWSVQAADGRGPAARMAHSMSSMASRESAVLFGGGDSKRLFADAWLLSLHPPDLQPGGRARWTELSCQGEPPSARMGHAATVLSGEQRIAYFGGFVKEGGKAASYTPELLLLAVSGWAWSRVLVDASGVEPRGRLGSAATTCKGYAFFYGGSAAGVVLDELYTLATAGSALVPVRASGSPTARVHAAAVTLGSLVVIVGGTATDGRTVDMLDVLDTRSLGWSRPLLVQVGITN